MIEKKTIFSEDRKYRYALWRSYADDLFVNRAKEGFVQFIGLNPSTADEIADDNTIRKCATLIKKWGYLEFCMTNLFAFRATDPKEMKKEKEPIGSDNDRHLFEISERADFIVCAWGRDGRHENRGQIVSHWLCVGGRRLHHLGLNDDGSPKHPLYLSGKTEPMLWEINI